MTDEEFDVLDEHGTRMLAELLLGDVLFLNSRHTRTEDRALIGVFVMCSDTFAYACADCEDLPYAEIPRLHAAWQRDPVWGPTAWCIYRRRMLPISPVENAMAALGYKIGLLSRGEWS